MVKEEVVKTIHCDMCDTDITRWAQCKVNLKGHDWDLCGHCKPKLQLALTLLVIKVGFDIKYQWGDDDCNNI